MKKEIFNRLSLCSGNTCSWFRTFKTWLYIFFIYARDYLYHYTLFMKRFLAWFLLFLITSSQVSASDYFKDDILGSEPETALLEEITLKPITLRGSAEVKRYKSTAILVSSIKTEAVKRFQDGTIPLYRRYDIVTSLDSFVYTMNQYFFYQQRYEQTKKASFRDSARSYLQDSRWAYDRLKASLKRSTY